ncbi:MAG: hypothetical protein M1330_03735 [Armatimonadetes bacterium]|nr:hypothetical protein [Armatimonadota bacterium]
MRKEYSLRLRHLFLGPKGPLLIGIIYLVYWQIALRIPYDSLVIFVLSTIIAMFVQVLFITQMAKHLSRSGSAILLAVVSFAIFVIGLIATHHHPPIVPLIVLITIPGVSSLIIMCFASSIGVLLSGIIREKNLIPPVSVVAAMVDWYTVMGGGPVHQIMTKAPNLAKPFLVKLPPIAHGSFGAAPALFIGFADFMFIAFFYACVCRFAMNEKKTFIGLCITLILYMLIVSQADRLGSWAQALPALVPVALVLLVANWRHFRYQRSELLAILYAGLIVIAVATGIWYLQHRQSSSRGNQSPQSENAGTVKTGALLDRHVIEFAGGQLPVAPYH